MEKQLTDLKAALVEAEKIAAEILRGPSGASPHAAPLRSRVTAALDSLEAHEVWVALPDHLAQ